MRKIILRGASLAMAASLLWGSWNGGPIGIPSLAEGLEEVWEVPIAETAPEASPGEGETDAAPPTETPSEETTEAPAAEAPTEMPTLPGTEEIGENIPVIPVEEPTEAPIEIIETIPTEEPMPEDPVEITELPPAEETLVPVETPSPESILAPEQLYVIEGDVLVGWRGRSSRQVAEIPAGVRVIGREAFRGDTALEIVVLPDSVEEIQENAFAECAALRQVIRTTDSRLNTILAHAFWNCGRLDRTGLEGVSFLAEDAFEGVPEITPLPEKTPVPSESPEVPEIPAPVETPETTAIPEPTVTPEPTMDPYEEIEWEAPAAPAYYSGGGSGQRQTHGKSRVVTTHDYAQVNLNLGDSAGEEPMHTLTLEGEELELNLSDGKGAPRRFTVALGDWDPQDALQGDALILRVEETTEETDTPDTAAWEIGGAALRTLNRSGVKYVVFQQGEQALAAPTEGFLAGWAYDELKSRGTAARRFTYTLTMAEGETPAWRVQVEGQDFYPDENPLAPMYLEGILTGAEEGFPTLLNIKQEGNDQ
ncbi:MAG: leucine-rich repeat protein [Clostridia bacterium]|nr:leucine-rich repeat protein [Clostridia bacterium]